MAAKGATPPLPYEELVDITVKACDDALSHTSGYVHAETGTWNNQIINNILSELVTRTSKDDKQPKFKYIVNSTVVQHRSTYTDPQTGKGAGRRGMHTGAGAYWDNERDGMWGFKYEASESKGLDVVVGINWVWVGRD